MTGFSMPNREDASAHQQAEMLAAAIDSGDSDDIMRELAAMRQDSPGEIPNSTMSAIASDLSRFDIAGAFLHAGQIIINSSHMGGFVFGDVYRGFMGVIDAAATVPSRGLLALVRFDDVSQKTFSIIMGNIAFQYRTSHFPELSSRVSISDMIEIAKHTSHVAFQYDAAMWKLIRRRVLKYSFQSKYFELMDRYSPLSISDAKGLVRSVPFWRKKLSIGAAMMGYTILLQNLGELPDGHIDGMLSELEDITYQYAPTLSDMIARGREFTQSFNSFGERFDDSYYQSALKHLEDNTDETNKTKPEGYIRDSE